MDNFMGRLIIIFTFVWKIGKENQMIPWRKVCDKDEGYVYCVFN